MATTPVGARLLEEAIQESVVLLDHDGLDVWDGWHRCAAAVIKGQDVIDAVIGSERIMSLRIG